MVIVGHEMATILASGASLRNKNFLEAIQQAGSPTMYPLPVEPARFVTGKSLSNTPIDELNRKIRQLCGTDPRLLITMAKMEEDDRQSCVRLAHFMILLANKLHREPNLMDRFVGLAKARPKLTTAVVVGALAVLSMTLFHKHTMTLWGTMISAPRVAFTLTRSTDLGPVSSSADLTVTFDHVLTDVGGSFTDVTNPSVFNCQHPGVYQFSLSALSQAGHNAFVKLVKNGQHQLAMWAGVVSTSAATTNGFNTAVLELEQGDQVWLAIGHPDRYAIHSNINRYISFTGVLLYSTYS